MRTFIKILIGLSFAGLTSVAHAITAAELDGRMQSGERLLLVDVRSGVAYTQDHIPGAINIPINLLPHKKLPAGVPVIVYGDGLGVISQAEAIAAAQAAGLTGVEALEGGFSGWRSYSNVTTAAPGLKYEKIPGITYDQLVDADRQDMVLIDLRDPQQEEPADPDAPVRASAAEEDDLVGDFAGELNMPVQKGLASVRSPAQQRASGGAVRASAGSEPLPPLLVLVADHEAEANQAARDLRAAGYHRFTILIGGSETIRHEGRRGMGRQGGELPIITSQP